MTKKEETSISNEKKPKKKALESKNIPKNTKKNLIETETIIIPQEKYFFLNDGRSLKDMFELANCLETINEEIFFHHVNDFKNDFSNWIKDVFGNKGLADEIFLIKDPKQTQLIILKHIAKSKRG